MLFIGSQSSCHIFFILLPRILFYDNLIYGIDSGYSCFLFKENDGSSASDTKPSLGLTQEDLSVLEKGFDFNTGMPSK